MVDRRLNDKGKNWRHVFKVQREKQTLFTKGNINKMFSFLS